MSHYLYLAKGKYFLTTSGEHDDYSVRKLMVATRDFDLQLAVQEHVQFQRIAGHPSDYAGLEKFLSENGFAAFVEFDEINLGGEGNIASEFEVPKKTYALNAIVTKGK